MVMYIKNMEAKAKVKKVVKAGTALLIYLPQDFVNRTGVQKGDEVVVFWNGTYLKVMPNLGNEVKEMQNGRNRTNRQNDIL